MQFDTSAFESEILSSLPTNGFVESPIFYIIIMLQGGTIKCDYLDAYLESLVTLARPRVDTLSHYWTTYSELNVNSSGQAISERHLRTISVS